MVMAECFTQNPIKIEAKLTMVAEDSMIFTVTAEPFMSIFWTLQAISAEPFMSIFWTLQAIQIQSSNCVAMCANTFQSN